MYIFLNKQYFVPCVIIKKKACLVEMSSVIPSKKSQFLNCSEGKEL